MIVVMPRPPNPDVHDRLMEAGRSLLLHRGFNGCGVQEITTAAGIPKGSFYSYFKSKEEFALAVLEEYWSGVENRFGGILLDSSLSPVERITRYFRLLSDDKARTNFAHGCLIGNLSLEIANASAQVRSKLSDIFERWEAPIIRCLREAQEVREIAPAGNLRDLAAAIIESWEGAAMRAKVEQKRGPYRRFEKVVLPGLLHI
jgi:TetR/AcrR family transcriptional regulator, transcriptional repressor for nem operon